MKFSSADYFVKHRPDLGVDVKGLDQKSVEDKLAYVVETYFPNAKEYLKKGKHYYKALQKDEEGFIKYFFRT
jgi:uncharacterized protein (DUF608 family)